MGVSKSHLQMQSSNAPMKQAMWKIILILPLCDAIKCVGLYTLVLQSDRDPPHQSPSSCFLPLQAGMQDKIGKRRLVGLHHSTSPLNCGAKQISWQAMPFIHILNAFRQNSTLIVQEKAELWLTAPSNQSCASVQSLRCQLCGYEAIID